MPVGAPRLRLVPIQAMEQVMWLRQERNRPELYKYFRQDRPITPEEQTRWWARLPKGRAKLFIVEAAVPGRIKHSGEPWRRVGYVGLNPLDLYGKKSEFGVFILPQFQGRGFGRAALRELLRMGFEDIGLSLIYSIVLEYPGERSRFDFYAAMGFEAYPPHSQGAGCVKSGVRIPVIRFFMTRDRWLSTLGATVPGATACA